MGEGEGSIVAMKTSEGDTVGYITGNARFGAFHETCVTKENHYYDKQIHTSSVKFFEGDGEGSGVVGVSDGDGLGSAVTGETEGLSVGYGLGLGVG